MSTKNYKITKDKPLPKSGKHYGQFCPFKDMEVGDSFLFSEGDSKRVQQLADSYGRKNGAAFFINMSDENVCWRVS